MTSLPDPARRRSSGAALGLLTAAATALAAIGLTPSPAAAATDPFVTSFEEEDPPPLVSHPYDDPVNMSGVVHGPGSLLGILEEVTASGENEPSEIARNLADGSPTTKWLTFASAGHVVYRLAEPAAVRSYTLTSANDAPERDPQDWTLQGSADAEEWVDLDVRTGEEFDDRGATNSYEVDNEEEFSYYRLDITANSGASATQLAAWDILDGSDEAPEAGPMVAEIGSGPISGYNITPEMGYTGRAALRYAGSHIEDGAASATNVLYENLDIEIEDGDELSYMIFPVLDGALTYRATYVAVDLLFSDGTRLSETGLRDENGFLASARAHGEEKALYANQWNSVRVDLSPLAGRTVEAVLLAYNNPHDVAGASFSGWLDDVVLDAGEPIDGSSLVNYVDTRRGTHSSGSFSRGNTIPATAVPNGFNFFTPMTDADSQTWLYSWMGSNNEDNLPELQGIGVSHQPSPWMGDRNQLAVMPSGSAAPAGGLGDRALAFRHDDEIARPDLYEVAFEEGIVAAVTPSDHAAVYRFDFPGDQGSVLLDSVGENGVAHLEFSSNGQALQGWVEGGSGLSVGRTRMFVYGEFDRGPTGTGTAAGDRADARYASFDTADDPAVELRLATSFISVDQAHRNLDLEVTGRSFEEVRQAAEAAWNERLGVIEVEGATDAQLRTLYSNLYRLNLYPNSQHENTGTAEDPVYRYASPVTPPTGEASDTETNAEVVDGKIYVNNGFWDTYRTAWPAYSLLYPDVTEELVDGFVQHYRDGGWISRWSSPGYADLMTGTSSDVAFAEAYLNGAVETGVALDAYDAALRNATVAPPDPGVGRKGLERSIFLGYTPEETHESVSWGLEGYINDYGIGQMALALAEDPETPDERRDQLVEEAEYLLDRATQFGNLFDESVGFFQARHADGSWYVPTEEYDPEVWGDPYTETNGWNFSFHAPFDVQGLAALYGGTEGLIEKLDEFYATPERADKPGSYGGVIHEMVEARDVRMGQLGMSNQVSHHIPYIYAAAGRPSETQAHVREIMQRLFVGGDIGQGYPGDEDNGEMSAWHILSSLGIYPLALGSGQYAIGSPLYERATVRLGNGEKLVVEAPGNDWDSVYVQSVTFDGEAITEPSIDASLLTGGGTLRFEMGAEPSGWGEELIEAEERTPLVDRGGPEHAEAQTHDGTDVAPLLDDSSDTTVTFESATPSIEWTSTSGPLAVRTYTLTTGASGEEPTSWTLEASADGESWTVLDERAGEEWRWETQTRPFRVREDVAAYEHFRLTVTETAEGGAPTLAEVELLVDATAETEPPGVPELDPRVVVSPGSARAGEEVEVEAAGYLAEEDLVLTFRSDPVDLGTFATDAQGALTATVAVPGDAEPGEHAIVAEGAESGVSAEAVIVILAAGDEEPGTDPGAGDPGARDPGAEGPGAGDSGGAGSAEDGGDDGATSGPGGALGVTGLPGMLTVAVLALALLGAGAWLTRAGRSGQ